MRLIQPHVLVQRALKKRQKDDPNLSIRQLAKRMNISPGYLSKLLKGQKALNKDLIQSLGTQLKMDYLQRLELMESFENKLIKEKVGEVKVRQAYAPAPKLDEYELAPNETEWILSKWYYIAVLDLITTADFQEDPNWIAKRLQIMTSEAQEALKTLERAKLIGRVDGKWVKIHKKIRFPTRISKEIIRNYHISQMKRAIKLLELKHSQPEFEARLISGITVAANPEKFEKVKAYLHKALYEAAEMLSDGPCNEIYQINIQFFPHTSVKPKIST